MPVLRSQPVCSPLMSYFYAEYWMTGMERQRMGTANHLSVPNQVFPTSDGYVVLIAPSDEMWKRLAQALDPETLDRPEFSTILDRQKNREVVVNALSQVTRSRTSDDLISVLGAVKVNVARVNSISEAANDEQLAAIGGVVDIVSDKGIMKAVGPPVLLSGAAGIKHRPAPALGAHTAEVMSEIGLNSPTYSRLTRGGAFGQPQTNSMKKSG